MVGAIAYAGLQTGRYWLEKIRCPQPSRVVMTTKISTAASGARPKCRSKPRPALLDKGEEAIPGSPPKRSGLTFDTAQLLDSAVGHLLRDRQLSAGVAHHRHGALVQGARQRREAHVAAWAKYTLASMRRAAAISSPCSSATSPTSRHRFAPSRRGDRSRRDARGAAPQGALAHRRAQDQRGPATGARLVGQGRRRRAGDRPASRSSRGQVESATLRDRAATSSAALQAWAGEVGPCTP